MAILEVKNIHKSFGRTEVLKDVSFSLEKGDVVSIIGSSGSGKTTLLRCLNFLEHPDKGIIRVNDETIFDAEDKKTQLESQIRMKRLHFGLVFQSFNLFPQYTALQNVMLAKELLAKEQPDYKARKKAAKQASADKFIEKLANGYETKVGDRGVILSGGERQRIAIARAILKNSPILIFDEATSALDSESEKYIQESMKTLMKNKTVIAVAHRLSTLREMDRIVVIEDGKIVEEGTHLGLLRKKGRYAKLFKMQSDGYTQNA